MEIRYHITQKELARWHRLNRTGVMAQWRAYLLVAVALIPSLVGLVALQSFYASLWMVMATVIMLGYAAWSYQFGSAQYAAGYECIERLTSTEKLSTFSRSEAQVKWQRFEELKETKLDFLFWHLGRCSMIPKRAIAADQLPQVRQLLDSIRAKPAGDSPALPRYQQTIEQEHSYPLMRYHYTAEDVAKIMITPFQLCGDSFKFETAERPKSKRRRWLRVFSIFGFSFFVGYLLMWVAGLNGIRGASGTSLRDVLICLAPFAILAIYSRFIRFRSRKNPPRVPTSEVLAGLSEEGITFGDSEAIVFYHWADVTAFYQNQDFVGFKTVNYLINVLPKRVLGDAQEVVTFMQTADELKRTVAKSEMPAVNTVRPESDNPYQPPTF